MQIAYRASEVLYMVLVTGVFDGGGGGCYDLTGVQLTG